LFFDFDCVFSKTTTEWCEKHDESKEEPAHKITCSMLYDRLHSCLNRPLSLHLLQFATADEVIEVMSRN
jgi:hypothetical protein